MQENRPVNNDEIKIDLMELFSELKKSWKVIFSTTMAFAATAAIYSFCIAKPIYQYNAMIRIPAHVNGTQLNTCVEVVRDSIGTEKSLTGVSLIRDTFMINLVYSGDSPIVIKEDSEKSLPHLAMKINKMLNEEDYRSFSYDVARSIKDDIGKIRNQVVFEDASNTSIENHLKSITEKVSSMENNYISPKVEIIKKDSVPSTPISPNKKKNVGLSIILGLFMSCSYIVGKLMLKK